MKAKDEAIKALNHLIDRLAGAARLDGFEQKQLKAAAEHALEQVEAIQEVQRARKIQPAKAEQAGLV